MREAHDVNGAKGAGLMLGTIFDYIVAHLSAILSIIGLLVTIYFAHGAKNAAVAAQLASNRTRLRLGRIEALDVRSPSADACRRVLP